LLSKLLGFSESVRSDVAQQQNSIPLFRRRNTSTGEHFYTDDSGEAQGVLNQGLVDESIACFVFALGQAPGNTSPFYRLASENSTVIFPF
jgi:hypothetical protein